MSGPIFNKAINTFFRFSIARGDGSHARALVDKAPLPEETRAKILKLIESVPVAADKREALDLLLGSTTHFDQRKPAKINPCETEPLSSTPKPARVGFDNMDSAITAFVLSFLSCKELSQVMEVNSVWQNSALRGACQQFDSQKTFVCEPLMLMLKDCQRLLHIQRTLQCFDYYNHVEEIVGEPMLFPMVLDQRIFMYWKARGSVVSILSLPLPPSSVATATFYFPNLQRMSLQMREQDKAFWTAAALTHCAHLHSLELRADPNLSIETQVQAMSALPPLPKLTELSLHLRYFSNEESNEAKFLETFKNVFRSSSSLNNLVLKQLGDTDGLRDQCISEDYSILEGVSPTLTALTLDVQAPLSDTENFLRFSRTGMQYLAKQFPALHTLQLFYKCIDEDGGLQGMVPFEGSAVLAWSWPNLKALGIRGVWSLEAIETIVRGHPHLETLSIEHSGWHETTWRFLRGGGDIGNIIAEHGQHLKKIVIDNVGVDCDFAQMRHLLTHCTRLESLVMKIMNYDSHAREKEISKYRKQFPSVQLSMQGSQLARI